MERTLQRQIKREIFASMLRRIGIKSFKRTGAVVVTETWEADGSVSRTTKIEESTPGDAALLIKMLSIAPPQEGDQQKQNPSDDDLLNQEPFAGFKDQPKEAEQSQASQEDDQEDIAGRVEHNSGVKKKAYGEDFAEGICQICGNEPVTRSIERGFFNSDHKETYQIGENCWNKYKKQGMKRKAADIKNRNDLFNELEKTEGYRNTHVFKMNNGDIKSFEEMDEMFNNKDGMTEEYFPIFTFEKTAMKKKARAGFLDGYTDEQIAAMPVQVVFHDASGALTNAEYESLPEAQQAHPEIDMDINSAMRGRTYGDESQGWAGEGRECLRFESAGANHQLSSIKKKADSFTATGYKADGKTMHFTGQTTSDAFDQAVAWGAQRIMDGQGAIYLPMNGEWTQMNNLGIDAKMQRKSNEPFEVTGIDDTKLETWFERDRAHVALVDAATEQNTIVEWWDDDVNEAVEDGFLDTRNYHQSAYDYAKEHGMLKEVVPADGLDENMFD